MEADENVNAYLDNMLKNGISTLLKIGIPVSKNINPHIKINFRAKRRLGCCIRNGNSFKIEIASAVVGNCTQTVLLKETLFHELLHTCPGCGNHGAAWKEYADILNKELDLHISRTSKTCEKEDRQNFAYILSCQVCKNEIGRYRRSKAVLHPSLYCCSKCGGKLVRIK